MILINKTGLRVSIAIVIATALFACGGDDDGDGSSNGVNDNGNFVVQAQNSQYNSSFGEAFREIESDIESGLNSFVNLPKGNILISFEDCGVENAFYDPQNIKVSMCYELFDSFLDIFNQDFSAAFGVYFFVLSHELGHALIDQLDFKVIGGEETAADSIAAVFMSDMPEYVILTGIALNNSSQIDWYDVHPVGPQRMANLGCWAVGASLSNEDNEDDPVELSEYAISLTIPIIEQLKQSGRDCQGEYEQQEEAVKAYLEDYLTEEAKKELEED